MPFMIVRFSNQPLLFLFFFLFVFETADELSYQSILIASTNLQGFSGGKLLDESLCMRDAIWAIS